MLKNTAVDIIYFVPNAKIIIISDIEKYFLLKDINLYS